jgi:hypothetical protein
MIIKNKILRRIYFINLFVIIIFFLALIVLFCIYNYKDFHHLLFIIFVTLPILGITFGLLFFIINIIVLIKYKNIIFLITSLIILLLVIYSFWYSFFGYFGILS